MIDSLVRRTNGNPKGRISAIAKKNGSKRRNVTKISHCLRMSMCSNESS